MKRFACLLLLLCFTVPCYGQLLRRSPGGCPSGNCPTGNCPTSTPQQTVVHDETPDLPAPPTPDAGTINPDDPPQNASPCANGQCGLLLPKTALPAAMGSTTLLRFMDGDVQYAHLDLIYDIPDTQHRFTAVWLSAYTQGLIALARECREADPLTQTVQKLGLNLPEAPVPLPQGFLEAANAFPGAHVQESIAHAYLMKAAQESADLQARANRQGHLEWSTRRFQTILAAMKSTPTEICAETWPEESDATPEIRWRSMFRSWRVSSGHWSVASKRWPLYGAAMSKGRNGIWYSAIIVVDRSNLLGSTGVDNEIDAIRQAAASIAGTQVCLGTNTPELNALALRGAQAQANYGRCGHFISHNKAEVAAMNQVGQTSLASTAWTAAFMQWRTSPGHWSITSRKYTRWGAAKVYRNGSWWYTLVCE